MKRESRMHINYVANQFLRAMITLSKGNYIYEKGDESYMSIPLPDIPKAKVEIGKRLEKLCKNVIKIESHEK